MRALMDRSRNFTRFHRSLGSKSETDRHPKRENHTQVTKIRVHGREIFEIPEGVADILISRSSSDPGKWSTFVICIPMDAGYLRFFPVRDVASNENLPGQCPPRRKRGRERNKEGEDRPI